MPQALCPDRSILAAFSRGELAEDVFERLASHVPHCPSCQELLATMGEASDSFLAGLRGVRENGCASPGTKTEHVGASGTIPALEPAGYELLGEVGRGGMGVVQRARDVRLNRDVAIKLLREDCPADAAVCARFNAEAQITGQLQHPGIPPVHELGTLPDGRPFLAMKLVKGRTLHELLNERSNAAQDRGRFIAVFEQVCQAVGYAHAHRVIHRDLKPGNVMVGAFGEVQVMDWGLAKVLIDPVSELVAAEAGVPETIAPVTAIQAPLLADSATRTGAVMGTPSYMAPEQGGGEVRKLNARSDVFGLGAILCQILTGHPPYRGKEANEVRLKAVRGELHEAFAGLDACGADPDLVALCKKCLASSQQDRPADGQAVAEEVARIRQAAEERARQAEQERAAALVREAEQRKRRRQLVAAAAVVTAVLGAGIVGTGWGLIDAREARDAEAKQAERERLAKVDADTQRGKAEQANERAQKRLKQIEKTNAVLSSVFRDLDPLESRAEDTGGDLRARLRVRLGQAVRELEPDAAGDAAVAEIAARLQSQLGCTLTVLGEYAQAETVLVKARKTQEAILGADHRDTLATKYGSAHLCCLQGKYPQAEALFKEVVHRYTATLGSDHADTLVASTGLGLVYVAEGKFAPAEEVYQQVLRVNLSHGGAKSLETLTAKHNLADVYVALAKYPQAEKLYGEALDGRTALLGAEHPRTINTRSALAMLRYYEGKFSQAEALLTALLAVTAAKLGADHPRTITTKHNLALACQSQGKLPLAETLYHEVLKAQTAKLPANHPETLRTKNHLADLYFSLAKYAPAERLYQEVLAGRTATLGVQHVDTIKTRYGIARLYERHGDFALAESVYKEILAGLAAQRAFDHSDVLIAKHLLATFYGARKKWDLSTPLFEETVQASRKKLGAEHPITVNTLAKLGINYRDTGRIEDGLRYLEEALAGLQKNPGPSADLAWIPGALAYTYDQRKQYAKSEPLYREALEKSRRQTGADHPQSAGWMAVLAGNLVSQEKFAEAETMLRRCLAIREKKEPEAWTTFNTRSLLGAALAGRKKYADAELLLLSGYEGMKQREAQIPPPFRQVRLTEALDRLVRLYKATGNVKKLVAWHQEREKRTRAEERAKKK